MARYILTLRCVDRPGIVRAAANGIFECTGNILDSAQFSDPPSGIFCLRTSFETESERSDELRAILWEHLVPFGADLSLRAAEQHRRLLIMVSRADHCLIDLLYRWRNGELPVEIPLVVSNHEDCAPVALRNGVEFVHLPVTPATKPDVEQQISSLVDEHEIDLVVLARYMQVLSADFCAGLVGRIINIHHSFLPGFKGARPYHQAYERGVKLIGATAHYVTAALDEGPIIDQDVVRVTHAQSPEDLAAIGRDVERTVLARAVRLHVEDRIALVGNRTVVF